MSDELITIPKLTAQILFDELTTTLDFGSGFLDTEEVEALRALAVALGVNPLKGTPAEFVKHYPHPFKPMTDDRQVMRVFDAGKMDLEPPSPHYPGGRFVHVPDPAKMPSFVPCQAGAYPYCQKPESDPIHTAAEATVSEDAA